MKMLKNATIKLMIIVCFSSMIISCGEEDSNVSDLSLDASSDVYSFERFGSQDASGMQGDTIFALGRNLNKVTKVSILDGGNEIDIPFITFDNAKFKLRFIIPTFAEGQLSSFGTKQLVLANANGNVEKDFELLAPPPREITIMVTDFDGGGFAEAQSDQWGCFGAIDGSAGVGSNDGIDGNYYQVVWGGSTDPGFVGCQSGALPESGIVETDTDKVFIVFDANPVGVTGSIMEVVLRDRDTSSSNSGQPFTERYTFENDGWQEVKIPLSAFGVGFSPNDQSRDIDPAEISRVQISIAQFSGAGASTVRVDNIRYFIEP